MTRSADQSGMILVVGKTTAPRKEHKMAKRPTNPHGRGGKEYPTNPPNDASLREQRRRDEGCQRCHAQVKMTSQKSVTRDGNKVIEGRASKKAGVGNHYCADCAKKRVAEVKRQIERAKRTGGKQAGSARQATAKPKAKPKAKATRKRATSKASGNGKAKAKPARKPARKPAAKAAAASSEDSPF